MPWLDFLCLVLTLSSIRYCGTILLIDLALEFIEQSPTVIML